MACGVGNGGRLWLARRLLVEWQGAGEYCRDLSFYSNPITMEHKNENLQSSAGFCWAEFQLEESQLTPLQLLMVEESDFPAKLAFTSFHKVWPNVTAIR